MQKIKYRKSIYLLLIITITFLIYYSSKSNDSFWWQEPEVKTFFRDDFKTEDDQKCQGNGQDTRSCEKWMIIYSTNQPTENLKDLNGVMYDWCLLVVGDLETTKDWCYKDVVYLDTNAQSELSNRFEIIKDLPYSTYKRKTIGYLYAIENGARFIYDTDENVFLPEGLFRFRYESFDGVVVNNKSQDVYFDPVEDYFKQQKTFNFSIYSNKIPSIQQGLILEEDNQHSIDFNSPPIVLNQNQFSQISSMNTLYHYDSFWSLVFSLEADEEIRSYLAIKLLDILGLKVAFIPTFVKITNRTIIKAQKSQNTQLLNAIKNWKCHNLTRFTDCFLESIDYLIEEKFLNASERQFYEKWIKSLDLAEYKWPEINVQKSKNKEIKYLKLVETPESKEINRKQTELIRKNCPASNNTKSSSLIYIEKLVVITFGSTIDDVNYISNNIGSHFLYIIICIEENVDLTDFKSIFGMVIISIDANSTTGYQNCLSNAFNIGFKQQSFLIIMNPRKFDYWNFELSQTSVQPVEHELNEEKYFKREKDVYFIRRNVASSLRLMKFKKTGFFKSPCKYYEDSQLRPLLIDFENTISSLLNFHQNDLVAEHCGSNLKQRKIWLLASDDGVRVDVTTTLVHLNQIAVLVSPKLFRSAYPDSIRLGQINYLLSNYIQHYETLGDELENAFRENFLFYQNRSEFRQIDAVFCSSPLPICEGFISLNRTLILSPIWKYNEGRCNETRWAKLNENYRKLMNKSKEIVASMSRYAGEYQEHYSGFKSEYRLYSFSGFYAKNINRYPSRSEILIGPNRLGTREKMWYKDLKTFYSEYRYYIKFIN